MLGGRQAVASHNTISSSRGSQEHRTIAAWNSVKPALDVQETICRSGGPHGTSQQSLRSLRLLQEPFQLGYYPGLHFLKTCAMRGVAQSLASLHILRAPEGPALAGDIRELALRATDAVNHGTRLDTCCDTSDIATGHSECCTSSCVCWEITLALLCSDGSGNASKKYALDNGSVVIGDVPKGSIGPTTCLNGGASCRMVTAWRRCLDNASETPADISASTRSG